MLIEQNDSDKITRKCLVLFPCKIQTQQPLQTVSLDKEKMFVEIIYDGDINVNYIRFSDEAHF